jgi:hypothetical protein
MTFDSFGLFDDTLFFKGFKYSNFFVPANPGIFCYLSSKFIKKAEKARNTWILKGYLTSS